MNEASGIHRALEAIPKFSGTDFRTWDDKIRAGVSLYAVEILELLDGATCPAATDTNATEVATWHRNNARLYSLLFLATEGSACITVKKYKARPAAGSKADGVAAWAALSARYDGNTKEARRSCRENLLHASMKSGRDPTDFIAEVDDLRVRLEDMGEQVSDDLIEDVILRGLPKEYDLLRQQSHSDRAFDLQKIKSTAVNMFIDEFSRNKSSDPTVAGRGVAMTVARNDDNRSKRGKGKKPWKKNSGGVRSSKWCSVHKSTNRSDAECRKTERGEQETYCSSCPSQLRTRGYQFFTCGFRSAVPYVRLLLRRWRIVFGLWTCRTSSRDSGSSRP